MAELFHSNSGLNGPALWAHSSLNAKGLTGQFNPELPWSATPISVDFRYGDGAPVGDAGAL
jgi:hypothetical protein